MAVIRIDRQVAEKVQEKQEQIHKVRGYWPSKNEAVKALLGIGK